MHDKVIELHFYVSDKFLLILLEHLFKKEFIFPDHRSSVAS